MWFWKDEALATDSKKRIIEHIKSTLQSGGLHFPSYEELKTD